MILERLGVRDFRNLEPQQIRFGAGINVLHGENAQGKTNVLEAIHLLSTLYSFRTRRLRDMVRQSEDTAETEAFVEDEWGATQLRIAVSASRKDAWIDGKEPVSAAGYLRIFPTVFFGPQDMDLPRGDQGLRRRYLDRATFLADAAHLERLRTYRRALAQRNGAIRDGRRDLEPWSQYVARVGWEVHDARRRTLATLGESVAALHREISGDRETSRLRLASSWDDTGDWQQLHRALNEAQAEDRQRGFTRHGPHRDRLIAYLGDREIGQHGSQGQQRTFALCLKLALLGWAREQSGVAPVFLLDDPGSELDGRRLGFLARFLHEWPGQTFIATVAPGDVPLGADTEKRLYRVETGRVTPLGEYT